ncbi:MAG: cytochrome ubiquinol oxidase subunit I [Myxococcota bacterium]
MDALLAHRFQFGFTVAYHYLFPQLTMGLALLIFVLKTRGLRGDEVANDAARFWAKIFGVNFVMGVVTGIPLEFQFGTNWSRFAEAAGGVIGQTLAMEGVFAFFMESAFLYALLFWEDRLGPRLHWVAALMVFVGAWLSGYFIVTTNAFMQHPVGHAVEPDGTIRLESLSAFLTNPWALAQYAHVMVGSVITASFVMAGIGAFYLLSGRHRAHAELFVRTGVIAGVIASLAAAFPTGDVQARMVAQSQPVTFAAMEGHFHTEEGAALVLVGQPDVEKRAIDNPIYVPRALSFLTHYRWDAEITGLEEYPRDEWPDNVPLVYYGYHVMVGLGTLFIAIMGAALVLMLWRGRLFQSRAMLWILMLALPFPYIANTAGWITAEMGRQPWVLHGLMRTADGTSAQVSVGNVTFTLLGFMGLYALLSVLFLLLVVRIVARGPGGPVVGEHGAGREGEVAP